MNSVVACIAEPGWRSGLAVRGGGAVVVGFPDGIGEKTRYSISDHSTLCSAHRSNITWVGTPIPGNEDKGATY